MLKKHSITIRGHRTSFSLENEFWIELANIAKRRSISVSALVTQIDADRDPTTNLSSSLRLFILKQLKENQS